jgi:phage major head subunit gpT-like protein
MSVVKHKLDSADLQYTAAFLEALTTGSAANQYPFISTTVTMTTKKMDIPFALMIPRFRKWVGERVVTQLGKDGFSITAEKFEDTISVPADEFDDDNFGVYAAGARGLGVMAARWPDQQVFACLEANTALGYDGKVLFAADHAEGSGTASNVYTGGSAAPWYIWDSTAAMQPIIWGLRKAPVITSLTNADDPNVFNKAEYLWGADSRGVAAVGLWQGAFRSNAALDETGLAAAILAVRSRKDNSGENLGLVPDSIMVPAAHEVAVKKLFTAAFGANGATNVFAGGGFKVYVNNRLSNT